ncbi:hypothetical protein EI94DRAFT_567517 [Lactarius quietus]|nr:hypothetical protein EI94DRAFT_567517 [Lactarius quietus]
MTDVIVKIMVEVLNIFAIVTKEMKQGRAQKLRQEACGWKDVEDALRRLGRLTQEEALMAAAQIMNLAHAFDNKVTGVVNELDVEMNDGKDAMVILDNLKSLEYGLLRQIRQRITILHATFIMGEQPSNASGAVPLRNGSPMALSWVYGKPGSGKSILWFVVAWH